MKVYKVTVTYMKIDPSDLPGGQYAYWTELKFEVNDLRDIESRFKVETAGDWRVPSFKDAIGLNAVLEWRD